MNELMHKVKYVLCDWLLRVEHEVIMQYFLCASNTRSTMEFGVCAFVIVWRACILAASALIVPVCASNT